jgi:hypothetical protein
LLNVKNIYLKGRKCEINNGESTLLWTDNWGKEGPLCVRFPVLYDLCMSKDIKVRDFRIDIEEVVA